MGADTILILGGTSEAYRLAEALDAAGLAVTTALAGRTGTPRLPHGAVRIGGFGGAEGLARFITESATTLIVDATHPFAARISAHAYRAAEVTGVALARMERPAWPTRPGWVEVDDLASAARELPAGACVFLTIGRQGVDAFFPRKDCRFICRLIEPRTDIPSNWTVIAERGPFTEATERRILAEHGVTHLVSKNSGAAAIASKLDAADTLGVTVVMVRRPTPPQVTIFDTVEAVLEWIDDYPGMPKRSGENVSET